MKVAREWEKMIREFMNEVHRIQYGGQKLRDELTKRVDRYEIKRFDMFCMYV